ncbi:MAG TPA: dienelactone hydrolase family protein [Geminicoccaceae bacterium]|nr:dienelactone hydrolase family protein [Geminicoccaceae bacterium]
MSTLHGPSMAPRAGGSPRQIVVLLHGVGADGNDLIGLAPMLAERLPRAAFFAPDAPYPCDMAPYGRQWFSLQDRRPQSMLQGIQRAAPLLDGFLDSLLDRHRLEPEAMGLVAFSQGTMMSLHVAPRRTRQIGAVLGFSGALLGPELLQAEVRSRPPVMLIHGDADQVVPVQALQLAVQGLQAAEIPVQWIVRPGLPHSIDPLGIGEGAKFLAASLAG